MSGILNSYGHWMARTVVAIVTLVSPLGAALTPQAARPKVDCLHGGVQGLHDASLNDKLG